MALRCGFIDDCLIGFLDTGKPSQDFLFICQAESVGCKLIFYFVCSISRATGATRATVSNDAACSGSTLFF